MRRLGSFEVSANVSTLFGGVGVLEQPAAARAAGFEVIESWWPFATCEPSGAEVRAFTRAVSSAGVRLHAVNAFAGDLAAGERGVGCDRRRHNELARSVPALVQIARETGCRLFNCLYGTLAPGQDAVAQSDAALDALAMVASALAAVDGTVMLEPLAAELNPNYPLRTTGDVFTLIDGTLAQRSITNVALQFDTFHLAMNGADLVAELANASRFANVQISDPPHRAEPGRGTLAFAPFIRALDRSRYSGVIACEYFPANGQASDFGWMDRLRAALVASP